MTIQYIKTKHDPCHCDDCLASWYKPECPGCGHHNSFWATVIESKEWEAWKKYNDDRLIYDFDECEELGLMSPKHWEDFIKWVKEPK